MLRTHTYQAKIALFLVASLLAGFFVFMTPGQQPLLAVPKPHPLKMANQKADELAPRAAAAVLMEPNTGTILYEKNMHVKLPPASLTKMMTMLLIMEQLEKKTLRLTDIVYASEYAASMGGSQLYLEPGNKFTVDEMLKGIVLESANDASLAMAEHIAGSEQKFIEQMNERALKLGMSNTKFANPHGLPVNDEMQHHYSTAHDLALLARELLLHEKILFYTGMYEYILTQNNGKPFHMYNSNKMLREYPGMDGLKTGFTFTALQCLVATAKREDMRLVAIVLGEPDKPTRSAEVTAMLDYGFERFKTVTFIKKGQPLGVVSIYKGKQPEQAIAAPQSYSALLEKNDKTSQFRHEVTLSDSVKAPIRPGQTAGAVKIYEGNTVIAEHELALNTNVEKMSFWELTRFTLRKLFFVE